MQEPSDIDDLFANIDFNLLQNIDNNTQGRFRKISDDEVDKFLQDQENDNTRRKTASDLRLLCEFLAEEGEHRDVEDIEAPILNGYICKFLLTVRKKDGSEYEPTSLRNFVSSFERHLKKKEYGHSIISGEHFSKCRAILKAKQKDLKSQGKGNKPRAADELSDNDLDAMYEAGTLGLGNRVSLLHSMWTVCTLFFGMRTGKEVHQMKWGDVQLHKEMVNGKHEEYLVFSSERQSKTRTGANPNDIRKKPRAYANHTQPDRDPVACYKKYRETRPESMLHPDSPFFLAINHNGKATSPWYKSNAMGLNKLYSIMSDMKSGTTITEDKRLTPYRYYHHYI